MFIMVSSAKQNSPLRLTYTTQWRVVYVFVFIYSWY